MAGQEEFLVLISEIAAEINGAALDSELEARLNEQLPATGAKRSRLAALCPDRATTRQSQAGTLMCFTFCRRAQSNSPVNSR